MPRVLSGHSWTALSSPIVTNVAPKAEFFPAERYHQDFLISNPSNRYIAIHDMPKLHGLKQLFPELYRDHPVLMLAGGRCTCDTIVAGCPETVAYELAF